MAIQEFAYSDGFANKTQNYLIDWARRTGNMGNLANYGVECREDGSTGREIFYIRDVADFTASMSQDASAPQVIDISSPTDLTVAAEDSADA